MQDIYQIYLISDSTGETLDRIFSALQAQFSNFNYSIKQYSFVRTDNQIKKIVKNCKKEDNPIILYTVVDNKLAKVLAIETKKNHIPCFGILGNLILSFSKLLNKKATHKPSGQHVLDEEYFEKIEAIQFTMAHDDGKILSDLKESDIILLGVSRTSKTPTSIYLANRGFKTCNIPIIGNKRIPKELITNPKIACVVGLVAEANRLLDVRKNRLNALKEERSNSYTNIDSVSKEVDMSKKIFKKYGWPIIDVTRKSVEETAASIIKIYEIINSK